VEAFLPIAALAGLKNLLLTGTYDFVHPAGLTILLAALACALVLRKSFCGAVCPVGLASDLVGGAGRKARMSRSAPRLVERLAGSVKYLFLAFFLASIFVLMDGASVRQFLASPYNLTADARMFLLFRHPSATFLAVLALLVLLGAVFRNAWCRWLCPYGALLGLLGVAGPCKVSRDARACDGCKRCQRACPMDIAPGAAARSPLCIGCGQCVEACPKPDTLSLHFFSRPVPRLTAVLGGAGLFVLICLAAMALGGWDSNVPSAMLRSLYSSVLR
jgi:polyferredoxin